MKKPVFTSVLFLWTTMVFPQIQIDTLKLEQHEIKNPKDFIITESKGGILDFNATLAKEKRKRYMYNMASYNKKEYANLLWGRAVRIIGIESFPEAIQIWEEINNRLISRKERTPMWLGFENVIII
jgi:hypothetical protein